MSSLHHSKRRPASLKPEDYDHEISLVDHTGLLPVVKPTRSRSQSPPERPLSGELSNSSSRRHSDAPLRKHATPQLLRDEIARQKYGRYKDQQSTQNLTVPQVEQPLRQVETEETPDEALDRGRKPITQVIVKSEQNSAIDILYENQRGGFLCGIPLFSGKALGSADPAPWTNSANKTSATNITNAQVPDPSWEWAWKEWKINLTDEVDEEGWEYSFMFSKVFSWHGPTWWSSFVRRRAWIRKRVKRSAGYKGTQGHMLNPDYFTIHPRLERSRSPTSTKPGSITNRYSVASLSRQEMDEEAVFEDITDITALMKALRSARIDREKTEAVESFIKHGGDDLVYLQDHMHEIMRMFIFQASRRLLLSHLLKIFNEASDRKRKLGKGETITPEEQKRLDYLEAAVSHADEEVKRLEFWSDVKDMAEKGETKGAVDGRQGWDRSWAGIDASAPQGVVAPKIELPDADPKHEGEGDSEGEGKDETENDVEGHRKGNGAVVHHEEEVDDGKGVNSKGKEKA